jgi:abortive infection bacteriophage resistance protein
MRYSEDALTVDEQIGLLLGKGLAADKDSLRYSLNNVSYHRLSGYWHSFREFSPGAHDWAFRKGTDFATVWDRYVFDRQLRLLVFDAIERVEVAIRNDLILELAVRQGPFGYLDPQNLPNIDSMDNKGNAVYNHAMLLAHARQLYRRELKNGNKVIQQYDSQYSDHNSEYLPYWMLMEIMEFGTLARIFWGAPKDAKRSIALKYGLKSPDVLSSWMGYLRSTRNACGHHCRFWNHRYPVKPALPNAKSPEWHTPVDIEPVKDRAFGTLTILKYLLGYIAPQSGWADRLEALFASHPRIDRGLLGYPENWRECPIWGGDDGGFAAASPARQGK